jgi:predicted transcriptional regulator
MSTISVRIPDSLHRRIKDLSKKEHVSMNQLIALAVAEKVSVLEAEDYLVERASRAERGKFLSVLDKIPNVAAEDQDKL